MDKAPEAFRTISEVAAELDVPQHVLRFWEARFSQVRPIKRGGGRRYYRPEDVNLLRGIRRLLYSDGFTIKGVQKILKERGVSHVTAIGGGATARTVTMVSRTAAGQPAGTPVASVLPSERLSAAAGSGARATRGDGAAGPALTPRQIELLRKARDELADLRDTLNYARESA